MKGTTKTNKMNQAYNWILIILLLSSVSACQSVKTPEPPNPNIVYILADDLGYGDISALNSDSRIKTPVLDEFYKEAAIFTDAHSNSSVCTPTRYGILTGQYCWRSRMQQGVLLGYSPTLIENSTPTVASYLQTKNYTTACIGKWHLGVDFKLKDGSYHTVPPGQNLTADLKGFKDHEKIDFNSPAQGGPVGAGFDYSFILPASLDFQPYMYLENNLTVEAPTAYTEGNALDADPWATGPFWRKGQMAPSFSFEGVLPTFTSKAIDFLSEQKDSERPFFLYFPMNAPHTPWVPTKEFQGTSPIDEYGDFVQMVDAEVGKLLQALKAYGLEDNTLVIITSDNGGYWRPEMIERYGHLSNHTFRGMKSDIYEGGHHIPFFVKWPGKVIHSEVTNTICLTDFFGTIKELLGDEGQTEDSYSFLPLLTGKKESYKRAPVIHHSGGGMFAIRDGDWKFVEKLGSGGFSTPKFLDPVEGGPTGQLYNLKEDPQETTNLFVDKPEKVEELRKKLEDIRGK